MASSNVFACFVPICSDLSSTGVSGNHCLCNEFGGFWGKQHCISEVLLGVNFVKRDGLQRAVHGVVIQITEQTPPQNRLVHWGAYKSIFLH